MFSIILPMDPNRLEQFSHTKRAYDEMPQKKEFLILTRNLDKIQEYLSENGLLKDVRLFAYEHKLGFNPSKALNLGVRKAKYENVIITSPEVKPAEDVLEKLGECLDKNIVCEVTDQDEHGNLTVLVNSTFRSETPAMYFLAMFKKPDIQKINGWDEEFMKGYAYEDNDFGDRWVRAGLPFEIREDIKATHQYHPRSETIHGGLATNMQHYHDNTDAQVVRCTNGLERL